MANPVFSARPRNPVGITGLQNPQSWIPRLGKVVQDCSYRRRRRRCAGRWRWCVVCTPPAPLASCSSSSSSTWTWWGEQGVHGGPTRQCALWQVLDAATAAPYCCPWWVHAAKRRAPLQRSATINISWPYHIVFLRVVCSTADYPPI